MVERMERWILDRLEIHIMIKYGNIVFVKSDAIDSNAILKLTQRNYYCYFQTVYRILIN